MSAVVNETNEIKTDNSLDNSSCVRNIENVSDNDSSCVRNIENVSDNDSSSEEDNDSSSSSSEDDDDDNVNSLETFSFTENSDLYIVSIDDNPRFYVKDDVTASKKMWEVARSLSNTNFFTGYKTTLLKISNNELHLLGRYRFFLVSYDTILHRISYTKIQECV